MNQILDTIWCEDFLQNEVNAFINEWRSTNLHVMVHTSGSTGTPKEIQLSKSGIVFSARNTLNYFNLNEQSCALLCLPLTTIGGKMMLVRALESKMKLYVQKATSSPLLNFEKQLDFIAITPMQLAKALDETPGKLKKIKSILVGGAPINEKIIQQLVEDKITVFHSYGMTETASHVALKKVGYHSEYHYQALPGITFEYGKNNTLKINYPQLVKNPIETNDVIELIDSKSFKWLGRADFTVNSGGIKIQIEEIERELSKLIQKPFFVFGAPDDLLGEKIVLVIESQEIMNQFNFDFLGTHKPRAVFYLDQFCYNHGDKLDRKETIKKLSINS